MKNSRFWSVFVYMILLINTFIYAKIDPNTISAAWLFEGVTGAVGVGDDTSLVAAAAKVKKLAGGMEFTEGPVWLPDEGILVFSDIPNSKLMQWREGDGLSLFRQSAHSNGNILDLQGRLISCQHSARNIVRTEPDGSITVLVDKFEGKRFNSPNDAAVRSDGTLWFTDPPWGFGG